MAENYSSSPTSHRRTTSQLLQEALNSLQVATEELSALLQSRITVKERLLLHRAAQLLSDAEQIVIGVRWIHQELRQHGKR